MNGPPYNLRVIVKAQVGPLNISGSYKNQVSPLAEDGLEYLTPMSARKKHF